MIPKLHAIRRKNLKYQLITIRHFNTICFVSFVIFTSGVLSFCMFVDVESAGKQVSVSLFLTSNGSYPTTYMNVNCSFLFAMTEGLYFLLITFICYLHFWQHFFYRFTAIITWLWVLKNLRGLKVIDEDRVLGL